MAEREKYVDESWKESAAQDKEKLERILKSNKSPSSSDNLQTGFQKQEDEHPPAQPQPSAKSSAKDSCENDHACGCGHDHGDHGHSHEHGEDVEELEYDQSQGISFLNHVATLSYQAMIFMGEIPNPMTNMPEENLEQAKFMIDTLAMLRDKTKGNLSQKESDILNTNLYQLQMRYIDHTQKA